MAAKDNDESKSDDQEQDVSLDMSQAAVKKMIGEAREKGYITYDQLNQVLPPDQVSSEQIEDVMSMLSEMGINIIEDEEAEEEEQKGSTEVATTEGAREVTLDVLIAWATKFMDLGRPLAEELLPSYTNVQELEVVLPDDLMLHARPASLIVGIVNHHGTPVEMELEGRTCNAGSILDLMVTVGSHPEARRFVFRGDEKPLRDVRLLFEHGLGEGGLDGLPADLDYLRA